MHWQKVLANQQTYLVLNPNNWIELSYGLHHNCLTINENTRVIKKGEELVTKPTLLSLFTD